MTKSSLPPRPASKSTADGFEPDRVVRRAALALREQVTGERSGAGFTRARVINSLHRRRRRRLVNWLLLSPALALLIGGSAWAQATHSWPSIWQAVQTVAARSVQLVVGSAEDEAKQVKRGNRSQGASHLAPVVDEDPAQAVDAPGAAELPGPSVRDSSDDPRSASREASDPETTEAVESSLEGVPRQGSKPITEGSGARPSGAASALGGPARGVAPGKKQHESKVPSNRRAEASASAEAPPASGASATVEEKAGPDAENVAFRSAYDLDHQASHHAALDAYEDYLRRFPEGRFALEARYSRALLLIRLGRYEQARKALEPFAAGVHGNYRRSSAQRLLDAIAGE